MIDHLLDCRGYPKCRAQPAALARKLTGRQRFICYLIFPSQVSLHPDSHTWVLVGVFFGIDGLESNEYKNLSGSAVLVGNMAPAPVTGVMGAHLSFGLLGDVGFATVFCGACWGFRMAKCHC